MVAFQHQFITNRTTRRWLMILDGFSRKQIRTSKEIADSTNTSIRTIISDMNELKEYFDSSLLVTVTKEGYYLKIVDNFNFSKKKRELFQSEPLFNIIESLLRDEEHTIDYWLSIFPISQSSFYRILKKLEDLLKEFDLKLIFTPVKIEGEEAVIRKFFHTFYYETETTPHTIFPDIQVQNIVIDFFQQIKGVATNNATFWTVSYWLYISLERFQINKTVKVSNTLATIVSSDPFFLSFVN